MLYSDPQKLPSDKNRPTTLNESQSSQSDYEYSKTEEINRSSRVQKTTALQKKVDQRLPQVHILQRAKADDSRLPATQVEAIAYAKAAQKRIEQVLRYMSDSDVKYKNAHAYATATWNEFKPMTPLSTNMVGQEPLYFALGTEDGDFAFGQSLAADSRFHVSGATLYLRARVSNDIDKLMGFDPLADIIERLAARATFIKTADPGDTGDVFVKYQEQFNWYWHKSPYATMLGTYDNSLDSKGPRTVKSRAIFSQILSEDDELKKAYDDKTPGFREKVDSYIGADDMNPKISQTLMTFSRWLEGQAKPPLDFGAFVGLLNAELVKLTASDKSVIQQSNKWLTILNSFGSSEVERTQLEGLLGGPAGGAAALGPDWKNEFETNWNYNFTVSNGGGQVPYLLGSDLFYWNSSQSFQFHSILQGDRTNTGETYFVRSWVMRGAANLAVTPLTPFFHGAKFVGLPQMSIMEPDPAVAEDNIVVGMHLFDKDRNPIKFLSTNVKIKHANSYDKAFSEARAAEDHAYFNNNADGGFLSKMRARGPESANVAEAVVAGKIKIVPLNIRHDSLNFLKSIGRAYPGLVAYYYDKQEVSAKSFPGVIGAAGMFLSNEGDTVTVARRASLVRPDEHYTEEGMMMLATHESLHLMDKRPDSGSLIERYKTEFRAYWTDGRWNDLSSSFEPGLNGKGPKSQKARAIFNSLYGSATYPFVKPAYDQNDGGFRDAANNYIVPDGINMPISIRIDALRDLLVKHTTNINGFGNLKTEIRKFFGHGDAPVDGVLTEEERAFIRSSTAWRGLAERTITEKYGQIELKQELGIPT